MPVALAIVAWRELFELWKLISDFPPRGFETSEDVKRRPNTRTIDQRPGAKADDRPVTADHLRAEGLGEKLVVQLATWDGFVEEAEKAEA